METHHLGRHCRLVTEGHGEARDVVASLWESPRGAPPDGRRHGRINQPDDAKTGIARDDCLLAVLPPRGVPLADSVGVLFDPNGGIEVRIDAISARPTPDRGGRHVPPDQERQRTHEPSRLLILTLDSAFVSAELKRRFGRVPLLKTWAHDVSARSPAVATLKSFCLWMAREMDRGDSPLASAPRVQVTIEKTLLMLLVECLAERLPGVPAGDHDLADAQVQAIETWVEANLGESISIDDLAVVAGGSPRSVQKSFRRLRGCSPMTWVTRRRLACARSLLDHADDTTTVTDVALDCGFFQFGRFAVRYRQEFHEKPSETLARARRFAERRAQNGGTSRSRLG